MPVHGLLGTATRKGDVFTFTWRYADEPLLAQLRMVASNATESTEGVLFNVYHS
jgi:hypothetical protein